MKVSTLITTARATVLKQLQVSEGEVLTFINLALLEVYKRFPVSTKEQIIVLEEGIHIYELNPDAMSLVSAYTESRYLRDQEGDLVSPTSSEIVEIPINDETDVNSLLTPTPGSGMISYPTEGQVVSVLYRAGPVTIESEELEEELKVTPQYVELLLMYIGYLGYLGLNSTNGLEDKYLTRFEVSALTLQKQGIVNVDGNTNSKLENRGFV